MITMAGILNFFNKGDNMNGISSRANVTMSVEAPNSRVVKQFIRNKHVRKTGDNQKRGIVLAQRVDDRIYFGYSFTNVRSKDVFNDEEGMKIAEGRLNSKKLFINVNSDPVIVNRLGLEKIPTHGQMGTSNVRGLSLIVPNPVAKTMIYMFGKFVKKDRE